VERGCSVLLLLCVCECGCILTVDFSFATFFFPSFFNLHQQMISNGQDHKQMWEGQSWTSMAGYGHDPGGHHGAHHGAPKVSSHHWSRPYEPAS
jgi:hypothetical protein